MGFSLQHVPGKLEKIIVACKERASAIALRRRAGGISSFFPVASTSDRPFSEETTSSLEEMRRSISRTRITSARWSKAAKVAREAERAARPVNQRGGNEVEYGEIWTSSMRLPYQTGNCWP